MFSDYEVELTHEINRMLWSAQGSLEFRFKNSNGSYTFSNHFLDLRVDYFPEKNKTLLKNKTPLKIECRLGVELIPSTDLTEYKNLYVENQYILNKNQNLLMDFINSSDINIENLIQVKSLLIEELKEFFQEEDIKVEYKISLTYYDKIKHVNCVMKLPTEEIIIINQDNMENTHYNTKFSMIYRPKNTSYCYADGVLYYNLRNNSIKFKDKQHDDYSLEDIFNLIYCSQNKKINENIIDKKENELEDVFNTPQEKFNKLSLKFCRELKIDLSLENNKKNSPLIKNYSYKLLNYILELENNLAEMSYILNEEKDEILKVIYSKNYKKCEKIYKYYLEEYEVIKSLYLTNQQETVSAILDESMEGILFNE